MKNFEQEVQLPQR